MTTVADLKLRVSTQGTVQGANDLRGIGKSAEEMADQVANAADRTGKAFDAMRSKARINDALERLDLRPFQRIEREIDQVNAAYNRLAKSGTLSADQMTVATKAHQAALTRLNAELAGNAIPGYFDKLPKAAGVSAAQTAAALRMIPAQMTDVVTQLQGGASPMTVLLQQGGQLKDQFGGVGPMLKGVGGYVMGLVGPVAVLAAGVATLGVAAYQGSQEVHAFEAALISTNGRIGLTSDQLGTMAKRMDGLAGVTRGQAAEALAVMAAQSGISAENIERVTGAAVRLQNVGGPAISETAARFSELAKDPLGAAVKLNEATGFLTEAIYVQIRALEARGQREQAAQVAQDAYTASMEAQTKAMEANMGTLERGWRSLKDVAREAWDAMLNVGREDTLDQQLAKAAKKVAEAQAVVSKGGIKGWFGEKLDTGEEALLAAQSEFYGLQQRKAAQEAAARAKADEAKRVQDRIEEDGAVGDRRRAIAAGQIAAELAQRKAATDAVLRAEDDKAAALAAVRAAGLVSEQEAARQSLAIEQSKLNAKLRLIDQEIKAEQNRPLKADDIQGQLGKQAKITDLQSQRAGIVDQLRMAPITTQWKIEAADLSEARTSMQQWAQMWTQADDRVRSLTEQTAQAQAAMIEAPIAAAAAQADLAIAKLQDDAARAKVIYESLIATLRANGKTGAADALAGKVQGIDQAAAAQAAAAQQKVVVDYLKGSTDGLAAGWDNVSRGIGGAVKAMLDLATEQANYAAALKMAGNDQAKIAQVEQRHLQGQIAGYGAMAGAAKGFFKEKTAAYKVLDGMEKASQALQLGLAIKTALQKIGLIEGVTIAKEEGDQLQAQSAVQAATVDAGASQVAGTAAASAAVAGQGAKGDPYTAWARMAAMAAAMAALGFAVSGGGGGGSTQRPTHVTGSGTTLGDSGTASSSIADSIDRLTSVDTLTMQYSGQMLATLRSIDAGINGLGAQVGRDMAAGELFAGASIAERLGLKFSAPAQTVGDIAQRGLQLQDNASQERAWLAGIRAGMSESQIRALMAATVSPYAAGFQEVLLRVADGLQAAAQPLGASGDQVREAIARATVRLDTIDLRGKTGEQIAEAISAALSKAGDQIAQQALPGFERFTQLGEAYYETVVRVGAATEEARAALAPLHLAMAELATVAGGADDVAAELVRNSIAARESTAGVLSSVGRLVDGLDGSAAELADSYAQLVDARRTLGAVGVQATALTSQLLAGAGGLAGLVDSLSSYSDWALSDGERLALATQALRDQFGDLGLTVPATVADYRALVAGIDTSTEAGQRLLGQVLGLAEGYGELASAQQAVADERAGLEQQLLELQGDTAAIRAAELDKLDASNRALQERIWALQDEQEAAEALVRSGQSVAAFIADLRGGTSTAASLSLRRATYASDLAAAQAGDADATTRVVASARSLVDAIKTSATDPIQLARDTSRIAAQLAALPATVAYQADRAGQAVSVPAPVATPTATVQVPSVPAVQTPAATTAQASEAAALREELAAMRRELEAMRAEMRSRGDAVVANTAKVARILDDVSSGGDAFAVTQG